jgi:hypothetical protein
LPIEQQRLLTGAGGGCSALLPARSLPAGHSRRRRSAKSRKSPEARRKKKICAKQKTQADEFASNTGLLCVDVAPEASR